MIDPVPIKRPPSDLPGLLRELADQAERGELTEFTCAYVVKGGYDFLYSASLSACLVMASMLWQNCLDRLRR